MTEPLRIHAIGAGEAGQAIKGIDALPGEIFLALFRHRISEGPFEGDQVFPFDVQIPAHAVTSHAAREIDAHDVLERHVHDRSGDRRFDETYQLAADMGGAVRLWELPSCREIGRLEGHRGWVQTVAFSPDGTRLVSGGLDTTGLVWDVSRFTKRPAKAVALTEADLEACWEDLGGSATRAYPAFARLLTSPKRAAVFLGGRLKPAPSADARRVAALIAGLIAALTGMGLRFAEPGEFTRRAFFMSLV